MRKTYPSPLLASLLLVALLLSMGCRYQVGSFEMLADLPINHVEVPDDYESVPWTEGVDTVSVFLVFPTSDPATVQGAMQAALAKTHGDVLVDVSVEREWFWIPLIYGYQSLIVRGRPVEVLHGPKRERSRRSRLLQGRE